jgi:hypothetical protein
MSQFVQSLEQRMFLSASSTMLATDLATVHADAKAVRVDAATSHKTLVGDVKTLATDVRALKVASNNKLMAKLNIDNLLGMARVQATQNNLLATGESMSVVVTAEGRVLLKRPTNTKLRQRLTTDSANLNAKVSSKASDLQTVESNWQTKVDADLNAIATNNSSSSSVATAVAKVEADIAAGLSSHNTAVSAFQAAVTALTTDLATV